MSSITGRIALVAYIVGAMLVPWTHHHSEQSFSSQSTQASATHCGCSSMTLACRSMPLGSSASPETPPPAVSHEVSSNGNDSESCNDECKICALLESGHPDAMPPSGYQFDCVTSRILSLVGIEHPNQEPLFLTAPRGPPTT